MYLCMYKYNSPLLKSVYLYSDSLVGRFYQHRCDSSCRCCAKSPCLDGAQSNGATPLATSLGSLNWNRVVLVRRDQPINLFCFSCGEISALKCFFPVDEAKMSKNITGCEFLKTTAWQKNRLICQFVGFKWWQPLGSVAIHYLDRWAVKKDGLFGLCPVWACKPDLMVWHSFSQLDDGCISKHKDAPSSGCFFL